MIKNKQTESDEPLLAGEEQEGGADKDSLSQEDINNGVNTFKESNQPHAALETPEGKNNGAKPAAYDHQQTFHP